MTLWASVYSGDTEFSVPTGDFSKLEIRDAGNGSGFHYFFDTGSNRLITDFILDDRPRVATHCQVTLIKKGDAYSPRIRIWKKDKTKSGKKAAELKVPDTDVTRIIKATVDTDDCHDNFWKLINFLQSFTGVTLPDNNFRVVSGTNVELVQLLQNKDKSTIINAVKVAVGAELTEADLQLLADRKSQLDYFDRLLHDEAFFESEKTRLQKRRDEDLWQHFFEENPWIFGYGLNLISCESLDKDKLEQITTGANVLTGAGKRADALLRTRGYISSLLFCEIKTDKTPILASTVYRSPDIYRVSDQVSGGLSQVQKTAHKATRRLASEFHRLYEADGTPLRVEISAIKPRQVLVVGNLMQLTDGGEINIEKSLTFELYRRSIGDVEIITFDELYERACYIVKDTDA
jgi:hypothetical protein